MSELEQRRGAVDICTCPLLAQLPLQLERVRLQRVVRAGEVLQVGLALRDRRLRVLGPLLRRCQLLLKVPDRHCSARAWVALLQARQKPCTLTFSVVVRITHCAARAVAQIAAGTCKGGRARGRSRLTAALWVSGASRRTVRKRPKRLTLEAVDLVSEC